MGEFFFILGAIVVLIGSVLYHTQKTVMPEWQRLYFFVIDNTEKSDVYLKEKFADRFGITAYKAQFLIAAGKQHDQATFQSLYESMPNTTEPLN